MEAQNCPNARTFSKNNNNTNNEAKQLSPNKEMFSETSLSICSQESVASENVSGFDTTSKRLQLLQKCSSIATDAHSYENTERKSTVSLFENFEDQAPDDVIVDKTEQIDDAIEPKLEFLKTKALLRNAETYELEKFRENIMIIFSHEDINGYSKRFETEMDVKALTDTFTKFGFKVIEHKDFTKDQIIAALKAFLDPKKDLSEYGCLAVAILTHGSKDGLLKAKDHSYGENEIIEILLSENQTLAMKPKIIIIQASPGNKISSEALAQYPGNTFKDSDDHVDSYTVPKESDLLILHSCYAGSVSDGPALGSWFIQELCKKIDLLALTEDFEPIMTEIKREVAVHKCQNEKPEEIYQNQMVSMVSTLIRKLFLRKFGDPPPSPISSSNKQGENTYCDFTKEQLNNAMQNSPRIIEIEPGLCFEDLYLNFMKICLKQFLEERPLDGTAKNIIEEDITEDTTERSTQKAELSKTISDYLVKYEQHCKCYEKLHLFNVITTDTD